MLIFLRKFLSVKYDSPVLFSSCSATFEKSFDDWAIFLSSPFHITFARTKTLALQALFIMHYFEMEVMVYNVHISQIMIYKALLWTDVFWISYIKWYIFYNNNLLVVLGSKQGRTLKLVNPKHEDWASVQLLTLGFNFFVYFLKWSSYFLMKINKRKVMKCLSAWSNFRIDLTWWMGNICQFS